MSKFLVAKNPPQNLDKNEYVIDKPDFYKEIHATQSKKPRSNQLTVNYLRELIAAVGQRYLGESFDALRTVNISKYVGTPCNSEEEVHNVLVKAFETQCPQLLFAYVEHCFKQRPSGTNFIFYSGNPRFATKLTELGYEKIDEKEFEHLKSGKPKKIVGKPAITAEQAAALLNG
jgi:hypothetical protein